MAKQSKKQNFLQGTAWLAAATILVKIIGAFYKIPLGNIIGDDGFGYFSTAYNIYNVLLTISTAGLPVAMSRMIARASSLEQYNQVRQIYRTARNIFLGLGIAGSVLMVGFCRQLASFYNQPDAWAAIGCLGPCVLLICIISAFRGFFQGQSNMRPTSLSQVLEAFIKLTVGIVAAIAILRFTDSIPLAAGGAILGVTASCAVSALFLYSLFRRSYAELPAGSDTADSFGSTARDLLAIAFPITIGSAILQVFTSLEGKIALGQLLEMGYTDDGAALSADTMWGIYNKAYTIFNFPCALMTPITISIIPSVTALIATGDSAGAAKTEESAIRVTSLIAMPCAAGLAVLSEPIMALLYGYSGEKLALAAQILAVLGLSIAFQSLSLVTTAMLQAHGHATRAMVNMLVGGVLNLIAVFLLTGNERIHILGLAFGIVVCYISILVVNVFTLHTLLPSPPKLFVNVLRPVLAAVCMGVVVYGVHTGLESAGLTSRLILCAVPIAVGIAIYLVLVVLFRALRREDCLMLPKGEKIANILHLK